MLVIWEKCLLLQSKCFFKLSNVPFLEKTFQHIFCPIQVEETIYLGVQKRLKNPSIVLHLIF